MAKGIYQYMDLETNEIVYVGKDSYIDKNKRYKEHLRPSMYDAQPFNRVLQNNPEHYEYSVLYSSDDVSEDDLNMLEISFIERYNPLFNFTKGGDGMTGFTHSEKTKKKMSESHKGKKHWNYGNITSYNTKLKLSMANNSSGYFRVFKQQCKNCKQGFIWAYCYYKGGRKDGKQERIYSVDIEKLEAKVKSKGLKWKKLMEDKHNDR